MRLNRFNRINIDWESLPASGSMKEYASLTPVTAGAMRGWKQRGEFKPHHFRSNANGRPTPIFSIDAFQHVVREYGLVHGWFGYKRCGCGTITDKMNGGRCRRCWRKSCNKGRKETDKTKSYRKEYKRRPHVMEKDRARAIGRASERRAIKRGAEKIYGKAIPLEKPKRARCYWCDVVTTDFHYDHVVPVSKGGHHANYNIVTACARCNMSKGAKDVNEWHAGQMEIEYGRG